MLLVSGLAAGAWVFLIRDKDHKPSPVADSRDTNGIKPPSEPPPRAEVQGPKSGNKKIAPKADMAWIADAEKELVAARGRKRVEEPVRGALMTNAEWSRASDQANTVKRRFSIEVPAQSPELLISIDKFGISSVMPNTVRVVEREAMTRFAARHDDAALDRLVNLTPELRPVLDVQFRKALRARSYWEERKRRYDEFASVIGDKESWSLLHPFDDLNGDDMKAAVVAVTKAKQQGLKACSSVERKLILDAGGTEFFAELLKAVH